MRTSIIITTAILLMSLSTTKAIAQDCKTKAENMQGSWVRTKEPRPTGQENETTKKFVSQITAEVDSIAALFIKAYPQPVGTRIDWSRVLMQPDSVTLPDLQLASYLFSSYCLAYECQDNKIIVEGETPITLSVSINDYYDSGIEYCKDENKALNEHLFMLPPQQFSLGGYPGFASIASGWSENIREMQYSVLVHKEGMLPYKPITIKEYLELCIKLSDLYGDKIIKGMMDDRKKGYAISDELIENQRQKKEKRRDYFQSQMKRYSGRLDKPAFLVTPGFSIAYNDYPDPEVTLFTTQNRGYQVMRPNPDYLDPNRAKWKPQYMFVNWTVSMNETYYFDKLSHQLDRMIREVFDFSQLGALLTD